MPGADPSADRALARQVTERLAASAGTVVFSYAQAMPELPETRLRASSLVEELGLETMEIGEAPEQTPEETQPIELEAVAEESWVPLADATVRGGAQILKDQAACAFRAFAQHRLSSSELESAAHGLNARERGNLVHVALEEFWTEVESQPRLKSLSEPDRMAALDRAIDAALEDCSKTRLSGAPPAWEQAYLELQRERLRRLLGPWLDQEMARTAPFTVKQREASVTDAAIGPLRLRLRVDRVDSTEAGDVLIDYKTGIAGPNDWLTDRPDEPQLPLYAVLAEGERLAGVAFASIRAGNEMSLSGYAAEEGILPRATRLPEGVATLEEQVVEWQHVLTHLAEEFAQGYAAVQPKEYPATCRHCAQRLLCRVNPASLRVDSEAGEEETNG